MGLLTSLSLAIPPLVNLPPLHMLGYLLLTYLLLTWLLTALYNIYIHPLRHFPGPTHWLIFPLLRHIASIRGTREHSIVAHHALYGPVVRSAPDTLTFTSPQAWADVYGHGRNPELPKALGVGRRQREPVPDILFADARTHARYRRALAPAFSERALGEQMGLVGMYIDLLMEKLGERAERGEAVDMTRWFNFTTFDLIGDLTFGEALGGLESGDTNVWIERVRKALRALPLILVLREYLPGLGVVLGSLFKKSSRQHQAMVKSLVQRRIGNAEYGHRGDFMDQMMRGGRKDEQLTDDELTVNADILMIAGSETTATLLTGVVYFLLSNPDKMERLKQEIRGAFARKEDMTFAATTARLPYLLACLNEAMRLYPPVPVAVLRQTLPGAPVSIAGYVVPAKVSKTLTQASQAAPSLLLVCLSTITGMHTHH